MVAIEETCIPSYLHRNVIAAGVAWMRLFAAVGMQRRFAPRGPVLDFGAASGELAHLLPAGQPYEFVEADDRMARSLTEANPAAARQRLEHLPPGRYASIFALDSLEHNEDVGAILELLRPALAPDGVFILSGPTENALYRLGRRIAGFSGTYHKTNIYDIETEARRHFVLRKRRLLPLGVPLFSVSCWTVR